MLFRSKEMTKADIINEVAIATGMPKKEVGTVVEAFMEEVKTVSYTHLRERPPKY